MRSLRLFAIAVLVAGALAGHAAADPPAAAACSCIAQPGIFRGDEEAVLVGTVAADDGTGVFDFVVERWFKGGAAPVVKLESATRRDGPVSFTNTCGVELSFGQRLVVSAGVSDGGVYVPSACGVRASPDMPEGRRALEAATAMFGSGFEPVRETDPASGDGLDLAAIAIAAVLGVVALVVALLLVGVLRPSRAASR